MMSVGVTPLTGRHPTDYRLHTACLLYTSPIARAEKERTRMAVRDTPSAREAITTFRVLERFEHGADVYKRQVPNGRR